MWYRERVRGITYKAYRSLKCALLNREYDLGMKRSRRNINYCVNSVVWSRDFGV